MNKKDMIFIIILILWGVAYWIVFKIETKKKDKEREKLDDTPIEVYKYIYDIIMVNNKKYQLTASCWVTYDFETFVKNFVFKNKSIKIEGCIINPENIVEAVYISCQKKIIKPTVTCYCDYLIDDVYVDLEVEEREVK